MKKLTIIQKEFLLNTFFKNDTYPGWRSIADKLLTTGQCMVGSTNLIWVGGIGNFIKRAPDAEYIGCVLHSFDLEYFQTSKWYQETYNQYICDLIVSRNNLNISIKELFDLKSNS